MKSFHIFAAGLGAALAVSLTHAAPIPALSKRDWGHVFPNLAEDTVSVGSKTVVPTSGDALKPKNFDLATLAKAFELPSAAPAEPRVSAIGAAKWTQARTLIQRYKKSSGLTQVQWDLIRPFIKRTFGWRTRNVPKPTFEQVQSQLPDPSGGKKRSGDGKRKRIEDELKNTPASDEDKRLKLMEQALKNDVSQVKQTEQELGVVPASSD